MAAKLLISLLVVCAVYLNNIIVLVNKRADLKCCQAALAGRTCECADTWFRQRDTRLHTRHNQHWNNAISTARGNNHIERTSS